MRITGCLLPALGLLAGLGLAPGALQAAAVADSKARLRQLVRLPRVSLQVGFAFTTLGGFDTMWDRSAAPKQLEDVKKSIEGNVGDAPRYYRLFQLQRELENHPAANEALKKAVELYRKQGAEQSDNWRLLAGFAEALAASGEHDEAERLLRRGNQIAPSEWRTRAALGRLLAAQSLSALAPEKKEDQLKALASALMGLGGQFKPSSAQAEKAQRLCAEALGYLDKAVELAPGEGEAYVERAGGKCIEALVKGVLRQAGGEEPDPAKALAAVYGEEPLADLQKAARLSPKDCRTLGIAVMFEVIAGLAARGMPDQDDFRFWGGLSEKAQQSIQWAMGRLVELGQGEDSSAAGACEILGTLQFAVMKDFRGAETNLRRAVSLEPSRDQAWEVLLGVLAETERWEDLLQVSLDRVKHRNTARNWVLVVKAYERLRQDDNMLAEAQAAREKYPEDFYTNLTLAAAIMKTSENREELAQAGPHFTKAEQLLRGAPGRERLTNLIFLRGLHLGLSGQTEPARELFKKLLELDKDNSEAKEALQALE